MAYDNATTTLEMIDKDFEVIVQDSSSRFAIGVHSDGGGLVVASEDGLWQNVTCAPQDATRVYKALQNFHE